MFSTDLSYDTQFEATLRKKIMDTPILPPILLVKEKALVVAAISLSGIAACKISRGD